MKMVKFHLKKVLLLLCVFVVLVIFLFSTQFNPKKGQLVKDGIIHNSLTQLSISLSHWFEDQVLRLSYKERYCRRFEIWNKTSKYPPVHIVAKQLNIKDGDSIFINGLHCGEWNVALKSFFPNIKLYGVDKDLESVQYVKGLINGTYKVCQPFELDKCDFTLQFDHAIVDDLLHSYFSDLQCKAVVQMIPLLKAGGSLYIGKTYENHLQNNELHSFLQESHHIHILKKCFWSQNCLFKRPDIVEILYSKNVDLMNASAHSIDGNIFDNLSYLSTSVFVYKHILLTSDQDMKNKFLPVSKYVSHHHDHICTVSESMNATKRDRLNLDKESIRKAVKDMKLRGLDMH